MAEGDRPTLFSENDHDSVLSCSVCYFTELREDDEVLSEAGSEVLSLLISLHTEDAVHPYLFEPERSSSELDSETLDTVNSRGEWMGNKLVLE